jgi:hypothetical protein
VAAVVWLICPEVVPIWAATITKVSEVACISPATSACRLPNRRAYRKAGVPRTSSRAARNSGISASAAGWLSSARASNWTPGGDEEDRDQEAEADAVQLGRKR